MPAKFFFGGGNNLCANQFGSITGLLTSAHVPSRPEVNGSTSLRLAHCYDSCL
jgi:hypothetical protein